jgi:hypothetical protein
VVADGGGIRGVSELLILHEIMIRIKEKQGLAQIPRPCQVTQLGFFFGSGLTSTCSILTSSVERLQEDDIMNASYYLQWLELMGQKLIAIMLGRLRMSTADAIAAYNHMSGHVFSEKKFFMQDGSFKATKLEEAVKKIIKQYGDLNDEQEDMLDKQANTDVCKA